MSKDIEIICIGNEILNGTTIEKNSCWLATRIRRIGGNVSRITIIRDEFKEIEFTIKEVLSRQPRWILTSGGLGPTYDDITIESIGRALKRKFIYDPIALAILKRNYFKRGIKKLNKYQLKMSLVPENSQIIDNSIGTAPSVLIRHRETKIICLPGVPIELRQIFKTNILKMIIDDHKGIFFNEQFLKTIKIRESQIAKFLETIIEKYDEKEYDFYIKTHAKNPTSIVPKMNIYVSIKGYDEKIVNVKFQNIINKIKKEIYRLEGEIL
ncbi:MAG: competence/damage-inducible protein A [Nitrososphaeraceae archaeon]